MIEPNTSGRDHRLNTALADYFAEIEAGRRPDRDAFLARYPDLADELESFFVDKDRFDRMAEPLQALAADGEPPKVRYVGDYELLAELGRGGMGIVYRARQASLQREVAVKMILAGHLASDADVQRFVGEARAAGGLDHPHIVPIYEIGAWQAAEVGPSLHYFSMKLIDGGSLAQRLPRYLQDQEAAAKLLATVAHAVHHAHDRGILHRDLKPANILIDGQGQPYVTDFGLSRRTGSGETQTGVILGTPSYMAPEQAMGQTRGLTHAADVYSLGAILYEMITGQPPFKADNPLEVLFKAKSEDPKPPRSLNPKADRDLETICLKCLQKEPRNRYATAREVAEDLERYLAGEPIKARPAGLFRRGRRGAGRKWGVAAVLMMGFVCVSFCLCAGLLLGGMTLAYTQAEAQADRAMAAEMMAREEAERARREFQRAVPDMMKALWDIDALELGGLLEITATQYQGETLTWRLRAQKDDVPTAALRLLQAKFLDANKEVLAKVALEGVRGDGMLLKRGESVTVTLKLPDAEVRKKTATVTITRD